MDSRYHSLMAETAKAELERKLNRSLMMHRLIERALHDTEALWQLRPEGGPSLYASVAVDGRQVTFRATGRATREFSSESLSLVLNGDTVLTKDLPWAISLLAGDVIELEFNLSLDTYALV
jgi:hypothetical protein